jgi:hypothetical protein
VAHHRNAGDLLWTYDIHLIASRLSEREFNEFAALARSRGLAAICASGLKRAIAHFHTAVPPHILEDLDVVGEDSEAFLGSAPWRGDVRLFDLRTLSGWRAKLQLIREVTLPSGEYILREYACSRRALIPALHVHRLTTGTWRLLRRLRQ